MSLSFYLNFYLSFLTEKWYIMLSLYLRGVGMGILFTPLLTLSLAKIGVDMMAQASSITNIVRQMVVASALQSSVTCLPGVPVIIPSVTAKP